MKNTITAKKIETIKNKLNALESTNESVQLLQRDAWETLDAIATLLQPNDKVTRLLKLKQREQAKLKRSLDRMKAKREGKSERKTKRTRKTKR